MEHLSSSMMDMNSTPGEEKFSFPSKLFKNKYGFGWDFGGSAIKIIHTTEEGDNLMLHFTVFSKNDLDKAVQFLTEVSQGKLEPQTLMHMCGVGTNQVIDQMSQIMNIRTKVVAEFDLLTEAFIFLTKHVPLGRLLTPPSTTAIQQATLAFDGINGFIKACVDNGNMLLPASMKPGASFTPAQTAPDEIHFPVLLLMSGSVSAAFQLHEDGTFDLLDNNPVGGKMFMALSQIMTSHTKTFREIHDMACAGDPSKVDQMLGEASKLSADDEIYGSLAADNIRNLTAYCLGHVVDTPRESFKKEDFLASFMTTTALMTARMGTEWAARDNIKQVFIFGGFANYSQTTRDMISKDFLFRNIDHKTEHTCDHWYLKHGTHLGAIGSLLRNLQLAQ